MVAVSRTEREALRKEYEHCYKLDFSETIAFNKECMKKDDFDMITLLNGQQ